MKHVLILMIAMFHHHPRPSQISNFIRNASAQVASYKDGSVEMWLEEDRIVEIEQDIDYLQRSPKSKSAGITMSMIESELSDLHDYDIKVRTDMENARPVVRVGL